MKTEKPVFDQLIEPITLIEQPEVEVPWWSVSDDEKFPNFYQGVLSVLAFYAGVFAIALILHSLMS